jgi:hypothetical protein
MTHQDLIDLGFKLCGVEEQDPYYSITFFPPFKFNTISLVGNLDNGIFHLYDNNEDYEDIEELKQVINIFI